ncbi:MAG: hypothetical protein HC840_00465 [Leptolyngbyaceae cyanobacterium RM2_2_4]|nr:hypothetical protein [Leptolyngbyaceae cyanobacterium RM2_2_4]
MKTVTVTMKFVFETEETDDETLAIAVAEQFEELVDNGEILIGAKVKIVDNEPDFEDDEPDFEDGED